MAKSSFFYTKEQVAELKRVAASNEPASTVAQRLSRQWKRSEAGVYAKICTIRKSGGKLKRENKMALPQGFSFDFTPKRAEMFQDHVRLYF